MTGDFPIPSAKKIRLSSEFSTVPPEVDEHGDDFNDLYGEASPSKDDQIIEFDTNHSSRQAEVQATPKNSFSLPGLGLEESQAYKTPVDVADGYNETEIQSQEASISYPGLERNAIEQDTTQQAGSSGYPQMQTESIAADRMVSSVDKNSGSTSPQEPHPLDKAMDTTVSGIQHELADKSESATTRQSRQTTPGSTLTLKDEVMQSNSSKALESSLKHCPEDTMEVYSGQSIQMSVLDALEEHLEANGTHEGQKVSSEKLETTMDQPNPTSNGVEGEAEYAHDSSPYESSSDESSDSSSEESDDSDDEGYELLDPAEQARRLMEDEAGSDEEGHGKGTTNGQLRTLNEKADEVIEIPDIKITSDMHIEELGYVEATVDNVVLIKAKVTGEYQVIEAGSLLCLENREIVGVVAETFGRVQEPHYCARFKNRENTATVQLSKRTAIFYVPKHSTFVFTKTLQSFKGSDASNIHDEEVDDDEAEFSDDEAEAEYKRQKKLQRQEKRGVRDGASRGRLHPPVNGGSRRYPRDSDVSALQYDDSNAGDEPYTPLMRPSNLSEAKYLGTTSTEYPQEGFSRGPSGMRGRGQRGRGLSRGRSDRRFGVNTKSQPVQSTPDLPLPPTPTFTQLPSEQASSTTLMSQASQQQNLFTPQSPYASQEQAYPQIFQGQVLGNFNQAQHSYNMPYQPWQQMYGSLQQQAPFQPQQNQQDQQNRGGQPQAPYTAGFPPGAFVNPAFFAKNFQNPAG